MCGYVFLTYICMWVHSRKCWSTKFPCPFHVQRPRQVAQIFMYVGHVGTNAMAIWKTMCRSWAPKNFKRWDLRISQRQHLSPPGWVDGESPRCFPSNFLDNLCSLPQYCIFASLGNCHTAVLIMIQQLSRSAVHGMYALSYLLHDCSNTTYHGYRCTCAHHPSSGRIFLQRIHTWYVSHLVPFAWTFIRETLQSAVRTCSSGTAFALALLSSHSCGQMLVAHGDTWWALMKPFHPVKHEKQDPEKHARNMRYSNPHKDRKVISHQIERN